MHVLRYLGVYVMPCLAYISFHTSGWLTFLPFIEAFVLIPFFELMIPAHSGNASEEKLTSRKHQRVYDMLVYGVVPVQLFLLWTFLNTIGQQQLSALDIVGRVSSMGLCCGVLGINVGHELGHRTVRFEQMLAKTLLLTSLYMHFFIEHNRGHHKRVSTREDPASSQKGEMLYKFWWRSVIGSWISAWRIERGSLAKKAKSVWTLRNKMIQIVLIQTSLLVVITVLFNMLVLVYFLAAALIGILLLETVNYIEHYGLSRKQLANGHYESVMPHHSWNSDHVLGRIVLFELSRHSDHHYKASRKYQTLRHMDPSPQMPTGYPGMMLVATIPPLWFKIMNPLVNQWSEND
ncbi:MAG: alkane 1-monooxygenase [Cyclobacteriaceae bacterium]